MSDFKYINQPSFDRIQPGWFVEIADLPFDAKVISIEDGGDMMVIEVATGHDAPLVRHLVATDSIVRIFPPNYLVYTNSYGFEYRVELAGVLFKTRFPTPHRPRERVFKTSGAAANYLRAFLDSGIAKMPPKEENTKEESPKVYV